jgi:hypothetical protein
MREQKGDDHRVNAAGKRHEEVEVAASRRHGLALHEFD